MVQSFHRRTARVEEPSEALARATYDRTLFQETFEGEFTYLNGFLRNARRYHNRPALTCPLRGRTWTYTELNADANRLANRLHELGVGRNDVVMFQLLNSVEFALLYLAPKKLGAISCPINYRLAYGETAVMVDDSQPSVFFYDSRVKDVAGRGLALARHKPRIIEMVDTGGDGSDFDQFLAGAGEHEPGMDDLSRVYDETTRLYTSGPSGEPLGVPLNNLNEVLSAHDVIMHFPLSPLDATLNMTPWFHRGGLYSGGPNPVFYAGAHSVIMHRFDAGLCLDYLERYHLSFLIGTPTNLEMLHDVQRRKPRNLDSLKGIITMGAPLDKQACLRYREVLTPNISNGYGTTEAFWNTFLRPYDLPEHAGSAGRSCTDDDVAVVKIYDDRLAEPDDFVARDNREVGEVVVRSPAKASYAYIGNPERAHHNYYTGWLYIGDLGTWDEDEFVTIVERKHDMIIAGGENIHPRQVENALNDHLGVKGSMVVGLPDEKWGEIVVAYVVRDGLEPSAAELNKHCTDHPMLARYKRPRYYQFVTRLPSRLEARQKRVAEDFAAGLFERP